MKKVLFTIAVALACTAAFAQNAPAKATSLQYMLIVRFKADFVPPSADAVPKNIKGWQELVSSFIVINAKDMDEARTIAKKCPVFEFNGSVEIRPLQETAH